MDDGRKIIDEDEDLYQVLGIEQTATDKEISLAAIAHLRAISASKCEDDLRAKILKARAALLNPHTVCKPFQSKLMQAMVLID